MRTDQRLCDVQSAVVVRKAVANQPSQKKHLMLSSLNMLVFSLLLPKKGIPRY